MRTPLVRPTSLLAVGALASIAAACASPRDLVGPRAGARTAIADTASVRNLPTVYARTPGDSTRPQPSAQPAAQRAPTPTVANGPYFEFQVEQPATPAPGNLGPRYPDSLKVARVEGAVLAQFIVDTNGTVMPGSFKVLKATHVLFVDAVRSALYDMRFNPARVGGRSVRQVVQEPFQFSLSR